MSKHTPGPWFFESSGEAYEIFICDENGDVVDSVAGEVVNEEDARLIAAAPELLEALQEVERKLGWIAIGSELLEKTRAVIAKATGEQS